MSDVFISYSRKDEDAVELIRKSLRRRSIDIWIDKEDIGTGSRWDLQIQKGIESSDKVLVMLSKASTSSANVSDEWSFALEKGKHIIPVLLEDCEVPMRIASLQRVEFVEDYDNGIEKLTAEIRAKSVSGTAKSHNKKKRKFKAPTPFLNFIKYAFPLLVLVIGGAVAYNTILLPVPKLNGLEPEVAHGVLKSHYLSLGNIYQEYSDNEKDDAGKVFRVSTTKSRIFGSVDIYIAKQKIEVPELKGMTESQAQEMLRSKGLATASITIQEAEGEEKTIFKQAPVAKTLVREGQGIDLYLVKEKILLPNLLGLNKREAIKALENLNLKVSLVHSVTRWNNNYGDIIDMKPKAGEKVNGSQTVKIWVADKGGWIYLRKGEEGDILKITKGFNLRKATDASTKSTIIGQLRKGTRIKILKAQENGWYLVRVYESEEAEETLGQI